MNNSMSFVLIVGILLFGSNFDAGSRAVLGNLFPNARDVVEVIDVTDPAFIEDQQYRVDCFPDADEYKRFCSEGKSVSLTNRPAITADSCATRGCSFESNPDAHTPSCYIPRDKGGYGLLEPIKTISDSTKTFNVTRLPPKSCRSRKRKSRRSNETPHKFSLSSSEIEQLSVTVSQSGTDKLRLTIRDATKTRYEVPVPIAWDSEAPKSIPAKMNFQLTKNKNGQVGFRVVRARSLSVLFDTSPFAHGFVYDDRFIQFITTIPSRNAYGFGENVHDSFRHILQNSKHYPVFARDQWPTEDNKNLYGTHPFYMVIESTGEAFGVFIFNSNAQDYKFDEYDSDKSKLTYRTVGGILDIIFFAGPTPEDVVRQYQSIIGQPYMPPYWSLGFQLSRYGFNNLTNMKAAVTRTLSAEIPLDVLYGDIDYFRQQLDFTYDEVNFRGLPEYIDQIHQDGMKFITILDPAIDSEEPNYDPYKLGQAKNIWIKWPENQNLQFNETGNRNMLGYVWPFGKSVFPDFFYPPATEWWIDEIVKFNKTIHFDGLWIDMNEPANFGTNQQAPFNWNQTGIETGVWSLKCSLEYNTLDNPFYPTAACGDYLSDKTLCMIGEQIDEHGHVYHQYDVHNLYGLSETVATLKAARILGPKRSIIISRSTFPTSGTMTGHWLGDNASKWKDLKFNIIGMLEFNLFGIPYIGADICGFNFETTEELCQRWMQLGAFNPFFRNHNTIHATDQDPGNFGLAAVVSNRKAVELRYTLNPYLYTLFHRVHVSGGTVIRSMAHVFPTDSNCLGLDEQFMWDSSLLIAPVIHEGNVTKNLYLPPTERWYDYYDGRNQTAFEFLNVPAPLDFIPLYLRGGAIIPHQESALNSYLSRKKPFYLKVALDERLQASGDMFWDDGDTLNTYESGVYNYFSFTFNRNRLTIEPWTFQYNEMEVTNTWNHVEIFGYSNPVNQVLLDGEDLSNTSWNYNATTHVLKLSNLRLVMSQKHRIVFL